MLLLKHFHWLWLLAVCGTSDYQVNVLEGKVFQLFLRADIMISFQMTEVVQVSSLYLVEFVSILHTVVWVEHLLWRIYCTSYRRMAICLFKSLILTSRPSHHLISWAGRAEKKVKNDPLPVIRSSWNLAHGPDSPNNASYQNFRSIDRTVIKLMHF